MGPRLARRRPLLGGGIVLGLLAYPVDLHAPDAGRCAGRGLLEDDSGNARAQGFHREISHLPRVGSRVGDLVEKGVSSGGFIKIIL